MISVSDSKDVIPKHTGGYMYIRHTNCHGDGGVMVNNFENGINKTYTFSSTITSISAFFFHFWIQNCNIYATLCNECDPWSDSFIVSDSMLRGCEYLGRLWFQGGVD